MSTKALEICVPARQFIFCEIEHLTNFIKQFQHGCHLCCHNVRNCQPIICTVLTKSAVIAKHKQYTLLKRSFFILFTIRVQLKIETYLAKYHCSQYSALVKTYSICPITSPEDNFVLQEYLKSTHLPLPSSHVHPPVSLCTQVHPLPSFSGPNMGTGVLSMFPSSVGHTL